MSPLWMSIEPREQETRLLLSHPELGPTLRARLPLVPCEPRALASLLEALVAWHGRSLCAVLDADAQDVRRYPERWARLLGDLDSAQIAVQWTARPDRGRDRFLEKIAGGQGKQLLSRAATGAR